MRLDCALYLTRHFVLMHLLLTPTVAKYSCLHTHVRHDCYVNNSYCVGKNLPLHLPSFLFPGSSHQSYLYSDLKLNYGTIL